MPFHGSQRTKVSSSELHLETFGYTGFSAMSLESIMLLMRTSDLRIKLSIFNKGKEWSPKRWRLFKMLGLKG